VEFSIEIVGVNNNIVNYQWINGEMENKDTLKNSK
jgi:hypothetical protein